MVNALNALFGEPDYSHIVKDCTITIDIKADEMAAILTAYDRGLESLNPDHKKAFESVINKLKDQVWP